MGVSEEKAARKIQRIFNLAVCANDSRKCIKALRFIDFWDVYEDELEWDLENYYIEVYRPEDFTEVITRLEEEWL